MTRSRLFFSACLSAALLAGCAMGDYNPEPVDETPSNYEFEQRQYPGIPLSRLFGILGGDAEDTATQDTPRPSIAVIAARPNALNATATLTDALRDAEPDFYLADAREVLDRLSTMDCTAAELVDNTACGEALAAYPGVRLVGLVESETASGTTRIVWVDTLLGGSPGTTTLPAGASTAPPRELLDEIEAHLSLAPWTTRAFDGEGESWLIAAGERSGLRAGDTLHIHADGQTLRAPTGRPIAWEPGEIIGKASVERVLGPNVARITVTEGMPPSPDNPITRALEE